MLILLNKWDFNFIIKIIKLKYWLSFKLCASSAQLYACFFDYTKKYVGLFLSAFGNFRFEGLLNIETMPFLEPS